MRLNYFLTNNTYTISNSHQSQRRSTEDSALWSLSSLMFVLDVELLFCLYELQDAAAAIDNMVWYGYGMLCAITCPIYLRPYILVSNLTAFLLTLVHTTGRG